MSEDGIGPDGLPTKMGAGNGASSSSSSCVGGGGCGQDDMQQDGKPVIGIPGALAGNSVGGNSSSKGLAAGISTASLAADGQTVEYLIKFETQMYKMRDEEYSIDVQVRKDPGERQW
jgi:hypothetical protein